MADPFLKFVLLNLASGAALLAGYLLFSQVQESSYRSHYLNLKNKTDYFKTIHNTSGVKLDKKIRHEGEAVKNLRQLLLQNVHGKVLEVAIGSAPNYPYYQSDVDLVGIDWSPKMLELARTKSYGNLRSVKLIEGDIGHLPFDDGSFDAVVCTFGLCSAMQPVQVIQEMRRVCAPEGTLVLLEHGAADKWFYNYRLDMTHYRDLCKTGCNNNQDVDQMVVRAHLQIVQRWREDEGRLYGYTLKPNK